MGFEDFDVVVPLPEEVPCHETVIGFGRFQGCTYKYVRDTYPSYCISLLCFEPDSPAVHEFMRYLALAPHDFVAVFGKHRGKRYGEIVAVDGGFQRWARTVQARTEGLKHFQRYLQRYVGDATAKIHEAPDYFVPKSQPCDPCDLPLTLDVFPRPPRMQSLPNIGFSGARDLHWEQPLGYQQVLHSSADMQPFFEKLRLTLASHMATS